MTMQDYNVYKMHKCEEIVKVANPVSIFEPTKIHTDDQINSKMSLDWEQPITTRVKTLSILGTQKGTKNKNHEIYEFGIK